MINGVDPSTSTVNDVVITSSSCFTPTASNAECNPDVPEFTAIAYFTPYFLQNAFSNLSTKGLLLVSSEFSRTSFKYRISFPEVHFESINHNIEKLE